MDMLDEFIRTAAHEITPEVGNMLRDLFTAEVDRMRLEFQTAVIKAQAQVDSLVVRFIQPVWTDAEYEAMSAQRKGLGYAAIPRSAVNASPTGHDFDADPPGSWRNDQRLCAEAMFERLCARVGADGEPLPLVIDGKDRKPADVTLFDFGREIRARRQLADRRRQQAERENALAKAESEERKRTVDTDSPALFLSPFALRRFK